MKKIGLIAVFLMTAIMSVGYAVAATPGAADVLFETDLGEYGGLTAESTTVESGNVSIANLDTNQSTFRWVGLMGNVTGNIVLGDSSNNILYQWTALGNIVYASTAGAITWASLADATEANVVGIDTWLDGANSDNYTNTFNESSVSIGSNIFTSISSDRALTQDNTSSPTWTTFSLWDTTNLVWAGAVSEDGGSFDNQVVDYQMIIPENGTDNDATATTYNLWVELQ